MNSPAMVLPPLTLIEAEQSANCVPIDPCVSSVLLAA
jgi:hypothetical protein